MMKRSLLCVALLLITATASAQFINACGQPTSQPAMPDFPDVAACAPAPFGTGKMGDLAVSSLGVVPYWYCPTSDGNWGLQWRVLAAQAVTIENVKMMAAQLDAVAASSDPRAALADMTVQWATTPIGDPALAAVWCPRWAEMQAGRPASNDGTSTPPAAWVRDASPATWKIVNTWAVRNGVQTNGHATEILFKGGAIYVKSPNGGIWWRWAGTNVWVKGTTTRP